MDKFARGEIIFEKLRRSMSEAGLDALVAFRPENVYYSSGGPNWFLYTNSVAGMGVSIIPRDATKEPVAIVIDFESPAFEELSWIKDVRNYSMWLFIDETYREGGPIKAKVDKEEKGTDFGVADSFKILGEVLRELDLADKKVGIEMDFIQHTGWKMLKKNCPDVNFVDSDAVWMESRMYKTPWEIDNLRNAAHSTQDAILKALEGVSEGTSQAEILKAFTAAVAQDKRVGGQRFCMVRVGKEFAPSYFPRNDRVKSGELIEFDCGTDCLGYTADMARTFVFGKPTDPQKRVHSLMFGAIEEAIKAMEPGRKLSEVFNIGHNYVREHGMPEYNRGHIGHGIGLALAIEEAPFLAPTEDRILEPGMVFCLELPYYGHGLGAISIEEMIAITDDGHEMLTTISRELVEL